MAKPNRMVYDRKSNMWVGRTPDGQVVHVSDALYRPVYEKHLKEKPRGASRELVSMTSPDYWIPAARQYEEDMGGPSPDLYVT